MRNTLPKEIENAESSTSTSSARVQFVVRLERSVSSAAAMPSPRVMQVAAMFGVGLDQQREFAIVPACEIPVEFPSIIFITGPSGGGKSTILSLLERELAARGVRMLRLLHHATLPAGGSAGVPPQSAFTPKCVMPPIPGVRSESDMPVDDHRSIVDCIGRTLKESLGILARVGLGDAFAMLRRPCELSDGQRARFALAQVIERAEAAVARGERVAIIADEFAATLDRVMAMTIARNLRKWISNANRGSHVQPAGKHHSRGDGVCLIIATTHDDLLESLQPDVLVWKGLGDELEVIHRSGDASNRL